MNAGASAGTAAAIIAAANCNAIKACGSIVKVSADVFLKLLSIYDGLMVVKSEGGFFAVKYYYMTSINGFVFHCVSKIKISLPENCICICAEKIVIPDL